MTMLVKRLEYQLLLFCIIITACSVNVQDDGAAATATQTTAPTKTESLLTIPAQTPVEVATTALVPLDTPAFQETATETGSEGITECSIGTGLRRETIDVLLKYKVHTGMVMSANSLLAEQYFQQFEEAIRILGAPSLEILNGKGLRANVVDLAYEALAYGLEISQTTPEEEWHDMLASTQNASDLANEYGKLLVMAPGFKLMSDNEELYGTMAAEADIWLFQTQQLQKGPPGADFRQDVERIIRLIRSGNPEIIIWAQITLPPDREPDAAEWLEYRESIIDLVDGTYIGVYTWERTDPDILVQTIDTIFETACLGAEGE